MRSGAVYLITLTLILSGCGLIAGNSEIIVSLPLFPSPADGCARIQPEAWIIEYPAQLEDGRTDFCVEQISFDSAEQETDVRIKIARGVNLPVLARPVFKAAFVDLNLLAGGYPAGAVYPADMDAESLRLHWKDGFACEVLRTCLLNSDAVTGFNTVRFREAIDKKAEELSGGCWFIDRKPVISRLGYGLFRESSLKACETVSFSIPVQTPGIFISDNPFYPAAVASDVLDVCIPGSRKTSFINPENNETVEVFFDESRWCWINLSTGASESGRR